MLWPFVRWTCVAGLVALVLGVFFVPGAFAQPATPQNAAAAHRAGEAASPPAPDPRTADRMSGGWWGLRPWLTGHGVTVDARYTASYQGLASGTGDRTFEYGGKADVLIGLDTGKMGLWKGGGFRSHLDYRHGKASANRGGAIFSVNSAQLWPVLAPEQVEATSLFVTQRFGERVDVAVGKINLVDFLAADGFFGGWGIDRFMNLALVAPPSGLIPPVLAGAMVNIRTAPVAWNITVFDPDDRTQDYFPGELFANGVNLSLAGTYAGRLAGRATTYSTTAYYSTAEGTDYSALPPDLATSTKQGSYNVTFQFTHDLHARATPADAGWALYVRAAIADGNPNYVQRSIIAGIGGRPLFLGRPQDRFGLAAFYYNLSDALQETLRPVADLGDESALTAFYSCALTRWLDLGVDLQYVNPARGGYENAQVAALRTSVRF